MRIPLQPDRRTTAALAAAAALIAGAATLAPDMHLTSAGQSAKVGYTTGQAAAGNRTRVGGCDPHIKVHGFDIGVCIDDRATGTTAYPDVWINTLGPATNCHINISVWDNAGQRLSAIEQPCTPGRHLGTAVTPKTGAVVHTFARLDYPGQPGIAVGDSPAIQLSPGAAPGIGGQGGLARALQLTHSLAATPGVGQTASALVTTVEALSPSDLDQYLVTIPAGERAGLNTGLRAYFLGSAAAGRVNFANSVLSRASIPALQAVKKDLTVLQPDLVAPATTWNWNDQNTQTPLFLGDAPSVNDGGQRNIEDCYFHAELLAIAGRNQQVIRNQIHVNANHTVSAAFYQNGQRQWVTVTDDLPLDGKTNFVDPYETTTGSSWLRKNSKDSGTWMALYEKAFAQLKGGYPKLSTHLSDPSTWTVDGFEALTGHPTSGGAFPSIEQLNAWWQSKNPVVVTTDFLNSGTSPVPVDVIDPQGNVTSKPGLVLNHNYVVDKVDLTKRTVELVNPWGPDGQGDGLTYYTPRLLVHWDAAIWAGPRPHRITIGSSIVAANVAQLP